MTKKIQIIMRKTHKKLGNKHEIIKVAQGYAFNYLIPNNLAEIATKGKLKHLQMIQSIETSKLASEQNTAIELQKNLQYINKITVNKKVGDKLQIFGSINDKEIIIEISKISGITLEKKQIQLPEIKNIGIYTMKIQLFHEIYVDLKLKVLPEDTNVNI